MLLKLKPEQYLSKFRQDLHEIAKDFFTANDGSSVRVKAHRRRLALRRLQDTIQLYQSVLSSKDKVRELVQVLRLSVHDGLHPQITAQWVDLTRKMMEGSCDENQLDYRCYDAMLNLYYLHSFSDSIFHDANWFEKSSLQGCHEETILELLAFQEQAIKAIEMSVKLFHGPAEEMKNAKVYIDDILDSVDIPIRIAQALQRSNLGAYALTTALRIHFEVIETILNSKNPLFSNVLVRCREMTLQLQYVIFDIYAQIGCISEAVRWVNRCLKPVNQPATASSGHFQSFHGIPVYHAATLHLIIQINTFFDTRWQSQGRNVMLDASSNHSIADLNASLSKKREKSVSSESGREERSRSRRRAAEIRAVSPFETLMQTWKTFLSHMDNLQPQQKLEQLFKIFSRLDMDHIDRKLLTLFHQLQQEIDGHLRTIWTIILPKDANNKVCPQMIKILMVASRRPEVALFESLVQPMSFSCQANAMLAMHQLNKLKIERKWWTAPLKQHEGAEKWKQLMSTISKIFDEGACEMTLDFVQWISKQLSGIFEIYVKEMEEFAGPSLRLLKFLQDSGAISVLINVVRLTQTSADHAEETMMWFKIIALAFYNDKNYIDLSRWCQQANQYLVRLRAWFHRGDETMACSISKKASTMNRASNAQAIANFHAEILSLDATAFVMSLPNMDMDTLESGCVQFANKDIYQQAVFWVSASKLLKLPKAMEPDVYGKAIEALTRIQTYERNVSATMKSFAIKYFDGNTLQLCPLEGSMTLYASGKAGSTKRLLLSDMEFIGTGETLMLTPLRRLCIDDMGSCSFKSLQFNIIKDEKTETIGPVVLYRTLSLPIQYLVGFLAMKAIRTSNSALFTKLSEQFSVMQNKKSACMLQSSSSSVCYAFAVGFALFHPHNWNLALALSKKCEDLKAFQVCSILADHILKSGKNETIDLSIVRDTVMRLSNCLSSLRLDNRHLAVDRICRLTIQLVEKNAITHEDARSVLKKLAIDGGVSEQHIFSTAKLSHHTEMISFIKKSAKYEHQKSLEQLNLALSELFTHTKEAVGLKWQDPERKNDATIQKELGHSICIDDIMDLLQKYGIEHSARELSKFRKNPRFLELLAMTLKYGLELGMVDYVLVQCCELFEWLYQRNKYLTDPTSMNEHEKMQWRRRGYYRGSKQVVTANPPSLSNIRSLEKQKTQSMAMRYHEKRHAMAEESIKEVAMHVLVNLIPRLWKRHKARQELNSQLKKESTSRAYLCKLFALTMLQKWQNHTEPGEILVQNTQVHYIPSARNLYYIGKLAEFDFSTNKVGNAVEDDKLLVPDVLQSLAQYSVIASRFQHFAQMNDGMHLLWNVHLKISKHPVSKTHIYNEYLWRCFYHSVSAFLEFLQKAEKRQIITSKGEVFDILGDTLRFIPTSFVQKMSPERLREYQFVVTYKRGQMTHKGQVDILWLLRFAMAAVELLARHYQFQKLCDLIDMLNRMTCYAHGQALLKVKIQAQHKMRIPRLAIDRTRDELVWLQKVRSGGWPELQKARGIIIASKPSKPIQSLIPNTALVAYKNAIQEAILDENKWLQAECLGELGDVYASVKDFSTARAFWGKSISLFDKNLLQQQEWPSAIVTQVLHSATCYRFAVLALPLMKLACTSEYDRSKEAIELLQQLYVKVESSLKPMPMEFVLTDMIQQRNVLQCLLNRCKTLVNSEAMERMRQMMVQPVKETTAATWFNMFRL